MSEAIVIVTDPQPVGVQVVEETIALQLGDAVLVGGGGGTSDHGSLTGLLDNDHPQYLQTAARLAEFDTEQARIEARQNLGVQIIDGGTF